MINIYKAYGQTILALNNDGYLTTVGSCASVLGTIRFVWSAAMDIKGATFMRVYGVLLMVQIMLGLTIKFATQHKSTYLAWVCLMMFTEGGHFTIIPNALKNIFGDQATSVYGCIFTYTGISSLMMIFIVSSKFGEDYESVITFSAVLSMVALFVLVFFFKESRLYVNACGQVVSEKRKKIAQNNPVLVPLTTTEA